MPELGFLLWSGDLWRPMALEVFAMCRAWSTTTASTFFTS